MAKFRTNHSRQGNAQVSGNFIKVGLFAGIVGLLFWGFNSFFGDSLTPVEGERKKQEEHLDANLTQVDYYLPTGDAGVRIYHDYYTLSYNEEHEQANWVAYELTREQLNKPWQPRIDNFRPDPKVPKASASPRDYYDTGYNRGHLVPVGDRSFSAEAMSETFYMSNISPQIRNFNGGIWRELEEQTRLWAKRFKHLYIVSGPILSVGIRERIGGNKVSVPDAYFKVILDYSEPEVKAIAFLIPNELSTRRLYEYAQSIDTIEKLTGLDFFDRLLTEQEEAILESSFDISLWPLDGGKEQKRLSEWNKYK